MLTLVSCWYILKAKFDINEYKKWISNLLLNVKNFKLVIFTDSKSKYVLEPFINNNCNIKIIILEIEDFFCYKFKDSWIKNHERNHLLNNKIDWKVNMLWSEKIYFVKRAINNNYFNSNLNEEWFGWCDIGYFRDGDNNMDIDKIKLWPASDKMKSLDKSKIYYTQACSDEELNKMSKIILTKNDQDLPLNPMPDNQTTIAGGFFLIMPNNIDWWCKTYYKRLYLYFVYNYLVKDDQIIIIDRIINNYEKFMLIKQENLNYDKWFAFNSYLI